MSLTWIQRNGSANIAGINLEVGLTLIGPQTLRIVIGDSN